MQQKISPQDMLPWSGAPVSEEEDDDDDDDDDNDRWS
jgi:hypothetical protein